MRIAVIGAPGAGKTAFARKLAKEHGLKFIDNIPQRFSKKNDLPVGLPSDFRTELMLLAERLGYYFKNKDGVFTSSVLDSLAYQGLNKELFYLSAEDPNDPDFLSEFQMQSDVTSAFLAAFAKTFTFDHYYFLEAYPLPKNRSNFVPSNEELVEFELKRILKLSLTGAEIEFIQQATEI